MSYVKIQRNVFKPIEDLIKLGLYKNEQEAISALIHDQAMFKVEYYGKKIKELENKYNMIKNNKINMSCVKITLRKR